MQTSHCSIAFFAALLRTKRPSRAFDIEERGEREEDESPKILHVERTEVEDTPQVHIERITTVDTSSSQSSPDEETLVEQKTTVVRKRKRKQHAEDAPQPLLPENEESF